MSDGTEGTAAPRLDRYIPLAKREIVEALAAHPDLPEGADGPLREIARRLGLVFHLAYFPRREALKDLYARFNPDQPGEDPVPPDPGRAGAFLEALDGALLAANFTRLSEEELAAAEATPGRVRARIRVPRDSFAEVRFYGRGRRVRRIAYRTWFGLRRETMDAVGYDHVVFVARAAQALPKRARRGARLRAGAIYLKLFRDIARADLDTLYPNAKVVMAVRDIAILVIPAVAGGVPILLNLLPAITVLLVVAGAYLGVAGTVQDDALKKALAALSGLGALGGFLMRQWIKYERQALKYQKQVADNAHYNNLSNNAGFFDQLVGASEESEVKEALLAYAFLLMAGEPLDREALDARIEAWLAERFGQRVDFEIADALAKLARLGLMEETGEGLAGVPPETALERLDAAWRRMPAEREPAAA
jgi:hypothetical protein